MGTQVIEHDAGGLLLGTTTRRAAPMEYLLDVLNHHRDLKDLVIVRANDVLDTIDRQFLMLRLQVLLQCRLRILLRNAWINRQEALMEPS